jgi:hypothetical protein
VRLLLLPLLLREHEYWTSAPKQVTVQAANGTIYNLSRWVDRFSTCSDNEVLFFVVLSSSLDQFGLQSLMI